MSGRRGQLVADALLAAVAAAALIVDGVRHAGHAGAAAHVPSWAAGLAIVVCAPLVMRRKAPLPVLLIVFAGILACLPAFHPYDAAMLVMALPLYTVARYGRRSRSLIVGAGTAALVVVTTLLVQHHESILAPTIENVLIAFSALAAGETVRVRRALARATRQQLASAERERESEAHRRVEAERLRIARDLHDTVAHALVAINVRASVAAALGDEHGNAALSDIKTVSAEALRDLRATLSLLRTIDDVAPTGPQPNLDALPRLFERVRATGVGVEVDSSLPLGKTLPSPVEESIYRIVQESLTNVMRHAGATTVRVAIAYAPDGIVVVVADDGRGAPRGPGGHGLQGMAERVGALGGSISAGPGDGGGWHVRAHLPLADGAER